MPFKSLHIVQIGLFKTIVAKNKSHQCLGSTPRPLSTMVTMPEDRGCRNLASLTPDELDEFLDTFDAVVLDCDGVVMAGPRTIPGVQESIKCLKTMGKSVKMVTNSCMRSTQGWDRMFAKFRCDLVGEDVAFPTRVMARFMQAHDVQGKVFILGPEKLAQELEVKGFNIYHYSGQLEVSNANDPFLALKNITDDHSVACVIVDLDAEIDYKKLMKAAIIAKRPGVYLLFGGADRTVAYSDMKIVGPKVFHEAIESVSDKRGISTGKMSVLLNAFLQRVFQLKPNRTLYIGDSLEQDMAFAQKFGFNKMVVLTGVTHKEHLLTCPRNVLPTHYLDSFGELHKLVLSNSQFQRKSDNVL